MRMFVLGPAIGPVRMGVSVGPEDFPARRPAPPARWGLRFAVLVALLMPVWGIGYVTDGEIGPSVAGVFWLALILIGGAVRAGVRLARYTGPSIRTTLRWAGTAVGAFVTALCATAFLAAVLAP